jgi:hypothetical protein
MASKAKRQLGVSKKRDHTTISDGSDRGTLPVEIVNDVAEEIATRRRKIGKVDLQTDTDGISCHLHVSSAKLASVDAVIQHVTNVVAAKQKGGKKCEFCEARFDNLKKTRIQIVRHMAKHFNEAEFLCDHEIAIGSSAHQGTFKTTSKLA